MTILGEAARVSVSERHLNQDLSEMREAFKPDLGRGDRPHRVGHELVVFVESNVVSVTQQRV